MGGGAVRTPIPSQWVWASSAQDEGSVRVKVYLGDICMLVAEWLVSVKRDRIPVRRFLCSTFEPTTHLLECMT